MKNVPRHIRIQAAARELCQTDYAATRFAVRWQVLAHDVGEEAAFQSALKIAERCGGWPNYGQRP